MSSDSDEGAEFFDERPPHFTFQDVWGQERHKIDELRDQRAPDGQSDARFSVAFSGGGIRAAAFQAGVLWRLAREGRLKDVEYLTAVSGGSYIASAFASHVLAAGQPPSGGVDDWYLKVVAKTLQRMQTNAGDFVRDCFGNPCYSDEPSGFLPRAFDGPLLVAVLAVTLLVHPLTFIVCFLAPLTLFVETYFGAAMRATFCAPANADWFSVFASLSHLDAWLTALVFSALATITIATLQKMLPACKLRRVEGETRSQATFGFLLGHSATHALKRLTWFLLIMISFVLGVTLEQGFAYDRIDARSLCTDYILERAQARSMRCTDLYEDTLWYDHPVFDNFVNDTTAHRAARELELGSSTDRRSVMNALGVLAMMLGALLLFAICFAPVIGSELFVNTIAVAGPLMLLAWTTTVVQYVVFGPITHNLAGVFGRYNWERERLCMTWCLRIALVLLPAYEDLRAGLHLYYKRCLKQNFFAEGEDVLLADLGKHPYCPFYLLTGTSNDFQPPGDTDKISELSFSCLHFGGEETGYVKNPPYRVLSKATAISGAGCLDAISLSMNDLLSLRFWLEVLNLSWGDYVTFDLFFCPSLASGCLVRFFHRLPSGLAWVVVFVMLNLVWESSDGEVQDCAASRSLLDTAASVLFVVVSLSFFTCFRLGEFMALSPLIRQLHQVTQYYYVGNRPPPMLYMTDGGVKDCTSIVQLLWRRRERILLVLAAADPNDELKVLRSALDVAVQLKLASFYDPEDPRRTLDVIFDRFKSDVEMTTLHIGISYCWDGDVAAHGHLSVGHLFIVKNRLPPSLTGAVRPSLKEEELLGVDGEFPSEESSDGDEDAWMEMQTNELGPFGCCDCCHLNGLNCGPKFPHGSFTGYLYLSPHWCSSLMRLGFDISKDAVDKVCQGGLAKSSWEDRLD